MKKIVALLLATLAILAFTFCVSADTFDGTMVRSNNADPQLFFHDGNYYMTQTGTSRIAVFETANVEDLASLKLTSNIEYIGYLNGTVYDPTITELFGEGATINGTWSPEIHYIGEELFGEEYAGWYMFLGLRQNTGDSSMVRMVVLKSTTDSPKGPYGHPTSGTLNHSQPLLDTNGNIWDDWACGQTLLVIPEGEYKGTYTMWVSEVGRGGSGTDGTFYQKIMIAEMKSPWQIDGTPGVVTTPTQEWEYAGASSTHPRVVEGATPVYGKNGEIFITYSGSGYWSDYGIGQLTWNGGNPLETSSWVKLPEENGNPIFSAKTAENLRGAGHASFLTDTDGNGFFCYHAYAYENGTQASARDAYIEPYSIDYTKWNGVSYGVISLGLDGTGVPADTASTVTFATDGEYLASPSVSASTTLSVTLSMSEANADGYLVYKSEDGEVFDYLTTACSDTYTDTDVAEGETYYYRVYAYRNEEISPVSETVSATVVKLDAPLFSLLSNCLGVTVNPTSEVVYDSYNVYRSTDNSSFEIIASVEDVYYDTDITAGETYYYAVSGVLEGKEGTRSYAFEATPDHFVKEMPAVEATCTTDGYSAYSYCEICEAVLVAKEIIPAIGHTYVETEAEIPATATSTGKTALYTCTACSDSYGGETIPALAVVTLLGDANGDGALNMLDVLRTLRSVVGEDAEIYCANADMNGDGEIGIEDVLSLIYLILNTK